MHYLLSVYRMLARLALALKAGQTLLPFFFLNFHIMLTDIRGRYFILITNPVWWNTWATIES